MLKPSEINTNRYFIGSPFQNSECETILRNIIMLQKNENPDEWKEFSWEDYVQFCSHRVTDSEKQVLNAFVNGGKPVWNTTACIESGWLSFNNDKYAFTEKMINMIQKEYC